MCEISKSQPKDGKTWKEVNKEHFEADQDSNHAEETFKARWVQEMHRQIIAWIQTNRSWAGIPENSFFEEGTGIRIMDYACGNGILSRGLAPYAREIRGLDISSTMVKLYNETATEAHLYPHIMRAVEADLVSGGDPSLSEAAVEGEFDNFDLAFISLAVHHVEDPVAVLRGMAKRVAIGGKVLVIDWKTPSIEEIAEYEKKKAEAIAAGEQVDDGSHGHSHEHAHEHGHSHGHHHNHNIDENEETVGKAVKTVVHHGFTIEQMHSIFSQAGLVNSAVKMHPYVMEAPPVFGGPMRLFYAVAEKSYTL